MKYPKADLYDHLTIFSPWIKTIQGVINFLSTNLELNAGVVDCMCGTGFLLSKLQDLRPDLDLYGIDNNTEFLENSKNNYPNISFTSGDILNSSTKRKYDAVISTGGFHHIIPSSKNLFIKKLNDLCKSGGIVIIADPNIAEYESESERKMAAVQLGQAYINEAISLGADNNVILELIEIMKNDISYLEYKSSLSTNLELVKKHFSSYKVEKAWPQENTTYGDYIIICKK